MSRAEFLRLLPRAAPAALVAASRADAPDPSPTGEDDSPYTLAGDTIIVGAGERRVEIRLTEKGERRLGSLRLPAALVRFDFFGFTEEEMARFMTRFDDHYRRGGG